VTCIIFADTQPDIVYLQIGGNYISAWDSSPVRVASDIISFANYIHYGLHVRIVIVGELLHRDPARIGIHYNCKVVQTNVAIQQLISSENNNNIIFWRHRGFWADLSFLSNDGVHLNHGGMLKYFKSVKSAVLHASHCIGNDIPWKIAKTPCNYM